jgi:hypothetical protein
MLSDYIFLIIDLFLLTRVDHNHILATTFSFNRHNRFFIANLFLEMLIESLRYIRIFIFFSRGK